ncbi:MAG: DNA mismatch repair protein MutS [Flavobacteriaceae bacterium]|nr:DNA mismatch repair protein MutS [Flavobacteriaceae bacterium]
MYTIHEKTLKDLEYLSVLGQLASYSKTEMGKSTILNLRPYTDIEALEIALAQSSQYLSSFENDNSIPDHYFESIADELKLLGIENSSIPIEGFRKISNISKTVNVHLKFYKKFQTYYQSFYNASSHIPFTQELIKELDRVIDRFGEVKDDATPELKTIRKEMHQIRMQINSSFSAALSRYSSADFLDEIRESVVENKRVLAVKAMHRKKIKGAVLGSSKTGSISYMEPDECMRYNRTLMRLEVDEKDEIQKILKALTDFFRVHRPLLIDYQNFLCLIDVSFAKAKYAQSMDAVLPELQLEDRTLSLRDAYHPLLYLTNKSKQKKTYPQSISLSTDNRIIVISGPNAGGKSITLKTVGLLQLMFQSGLLLPVHPKSKICLFDRILTDIGDNQSIENHLSTYSYRLKNMNWFFKKCNAKTLFLIDEFGTGSDPELGGALAESFLEEFYQRNAFGIITTHYSNLKILANELPHMCNANMLFDSHTLEPLFQLVLGQAGSSFTFEVAQKNGIPYRLINQAKKKIERGKVRFDATIAKLQKERSKMEKTGNKLKEEEARKREASDKLEHLNQRVKDKLLRYQEMYDHNQRMIVLGNKINDISEKYFVDKRKRSLISEFLTLVETENSKRKQKNKKEIAEKKVDRKKTEKEIEKKIEVVRKEKEQKKKEAAKKPVKQKTKIPLKVGYRVRMPDGKSVGTIDKIEKSIATVNYGIFTTKVHIDKLELVGTK